MGRLLQYCGVTIAQLQHATAILIGQPPSQVTLARMFLIGDIPAFPASVPSKLLERRPRHCRGRRQMQQENALIGVAVAAIILGHKSVGVIGLHRFHPIAYQSG